MAATTTLKLPEELKARNTSASEAAGKTPHAYMLDALAAHAARDDKVPNCPDVWGQIGSPTTYPWANRANGTPIQIDS